MKVIIFEFLYNDNEDILSTEISQLNVLKYSSKFFSLLFVDTGIYRNTQKGKSSKPAFRTVTVLLTICRIVFGRK